MKFDLLVNTVAQTHNGFKQNAIKAVNVALTLRNWIIGYYIVEFEQNGEDRAKYGDKLFKNLADRIALKGLSETSLKMSRQFYNTYPEIKELLFSNFSNLLPASIRQSLTDEFQIADNKVVGIRQTPSDEFQITDNEVIVIHQTPSDELQIVSNGNLKNVNNYYISLIQHASFSHFAELMKIENPTKRKFFELFILKTTPAVKELQRQISTLAYERVGLSTDTEVAFGKLQEKIEPEQASDAVKSIFFFDFLGLKTTDLIEEQELETALLDKFKHEHLAQLNTYVAYYREEVKRPDDNHPVGILLCTEKGKKLVEYALSGMDEQLFVSKYLLQLPQKEQLQNFIQNELIKWNS